MAIQFNALILAHVRFAVGHTSFLYDILGLIYVVCNMNDDPLVFLPISLSLLTYFCAFFDHACI